MERLSAADLRRSGRRALPLCVLAATCLAAPTARAAELLILDRTFTFATPCTGDCGLNDGTAHGYYEVPPPAGAPPDWTTPDDFATGEWHVRFEVLSQATSRNSRMQVCVWQSDTQETCSSLATLTGPGAVVTASSSPSTWWKGGGGVDYSNPGGWQGIGSPLWLDGTCSDGSSATAICDWGAADCCWADRVDYFPMTVRMIVVAVSAGATFSGWNGYVAPPPDGGTSVDAGALADGPAGGEDAGSGPNADAGRLADGAAGGADAAAGPDAMGGGCAYHRGAAAGGLGSLLLVALVLLVNRADQRLIRVRARARGLEQRGRSAHRS